MAEEAEKLAKACDELAARARDLGATELPEQTRAMALITMGVLAALVEGLATSLANLFPPTN